MTSIGNYLYIKLLQMPLLRLPRPPSNQLYSCCSHKQWDWFHLTSSSLPNSRLIYSFS